jgi:membrane associated rhomboid family serine protease
MGFWDRDYSREGPSFLGTVSQRGKVCTWLVIINVVVYIIQLATTRRHEGGASAFTDALVLNVGLVLHGEVWRLLTYAFLHSEGNVYHILFNMLFLWWFGRDVEDLYGPREFLAFYLVSAVGGGVAFCVAALLGLNRATFEGIPVPLEYVRCLGASAAVTAVLVLCACHFPSRIIYLFFLIPVPIWLFVVLEVAQDLFGLLGGRVSENVAFAGHVGGAACGGLYYLWASNGGRLLSLWPDWRSWQRNWNRPKLRVYHEEESEAPVAVPAGAEEEQFEAKLDALLEKVKVSGMQSLTDSERGFLDRASARMKEKRRRT